MKVFKDEYKEQKTARRKITVRMRKLRHYMIQHYVLLIVSLVQNALALFVVVNYPGPYKAGLFVVFSLSFAAGLFVLFSGLSK